MSGFRLAPVLKLRRTVRDQCEARAAETNRAASMAAERAALRLREVRDSALVAGDTRQFLASVTALQLRADAARNAVAAADAAKALHRERLDELVRASMDVAALEKLEQRAIDEAQATER
ncbi:MAG TPA: hypothetical protein VF183_04900, partial [Acidimicrobiales bacterium]